MTILHIGLAVVVILILKWVTPDGAEANVQALIYLVSAIFFISALRGLSSPETARAGNRYGIIGMALAIFTALIFSQDMTWGWFFLIILGVAIGGGIGAVIANRIPMTAMPQLVAAFHSLVGLAAVFVAAARPTEPRKGNAKQ